MCVVLSNDPHDVKLALTSWGGYSWQTFFVPRVFPDRSALPCQEVCWPALRPGRPGLLYADACRPGFLLPPLLPSHLPVRIASYLPVAPFARCHRPIGSLRQPREPTGMACWGMSPRNPPRGYVHSHCPGPPPWGMVSHGKYLRTSQVPGQSFLGCKILGIFDNGIVEEKGVWNEPRVSFRFRVYISALYVLSR